MTEWFTPQQAGLIGGIGGGVFGTLLGVYGGICGVLVARGIGRRVVLTLHLCLLVLGVLMLGTGIVAGVTGQPYHVTYPFVLVGLITTGVMGGLYHVMKKRYQQAEQRKLGAEELRRG